MNFSMQSGFELSAPAAGLFPIAPDVQPGFDFPQPLSEKYRPRTIADYIGLVRPNCLTAIQRWLPARMCRVLFWTMMPPKKSCA